MARTRNDLQAPTARIGRWLAASVSGGAALATILASAHSCGVIGDASASRRTFAALSVHWIGVAPAVDTATSIGDTLRFVATVTDSRGASLVGAWLDWESRDTAIAKVDSTGVVVARAAGTTVIGARVGDKLATARVVVVPRAARLVIGDTLLQVAEGASRSVSASAVDARGFPVAGGQVRWESSDSTVVAIDRAGLARGIGSGSAVVVARRDTLSDTVPVQVTPVAHRLVLVHGDSQSAPAGEPLGTSIVVRIDSRRGLPLAGVPVRFTLRHGGSLKVMEGTSDSAGLTRARWTLGPLPGAQRLLAEADGVEPGVTVQAEATPLQGSVRITVNEPDSAVAGGAVPVMLSARVTDPEGRLLAGIPVAWQALDSGSIVARAARTDSLGETHASWAFGPRAGVQRARVRVGDGRAVAPVLVTARALPGAPAFLIGSEGHGQKSPAGAILKRPLEIRVVDHLRNGVPGVPVQVAVSAGVLADSIVTTDSLGRARIRWTLGPRTGQQQATFRHGSLPRAVATVHAIPGAPAAIAFLSPPEGGRPGKPLARPVRLVITDAHGNRITDAQARFTVTSGSVVPSQAMPGPDGAITTQWKLGAKRGKQVLTASVRGTAVRGVVEVGVR